ncbi:HAD-IA family hydrolase [Rhodococcus sp. NPDC060090]|uniref:HAD-IA family hydrolase n=1 Tax=Rhodococcus sp. NPDC060090 TaxID=3347056 RepID=UPI0036653AFA
MAKPDEGSYLPAAQRLAPEPSPCVFIDDLVVNVRGAAAAGMVGVHHDVPRAMRAGLAVLFSIDEASEVADGIEGDASL